jgi:hypothetical protein
MLAPCGKGRMGAGEGGGEMGWLGGLVTYPRIVLHALLHYWMGCQLLLI